MSLLLTSSNCKGETHIIITNGTTAMSNVTSLRINTIVESGANPILLIDGDSKVEETAFLLSTQDHIKSKKLIILQQKFDINLLRQLGRDEVDNYADRVFVILPIAENEQKTAISVQCRKWRIPINVSDSPDTSTFALLSTFRQGDFQLGVTTSGKGCKLASRIKRELVGHLPNNIGDICNKIGELRANIQKEDNINVFPVGENDDDTINTSKFNSLIEEFNMTQEQQRLKRTRWLSQIVEYFPLSKLNDVSINDLTAAYKQDKELQEPPAKKQKSAAGSISLVGSGPGSVSLLTLGAIQEIFSADLILADKLVPQQVLDLIPQKSTKLFIARKFPGNAEKAQQELLSIGLESLLKGEKVVRLKQGDPYIFGRGGEEYNFFSGHGFTPIVIPGITSALSAPVLANIPVTHRGYADQVLICTGTGRRGVLPDLPAFVKSRTTVFLMALHRVVDLIPHLINEKGWDADLPVAIVERSSCPDQRVIRTTLSKTAEAVEACGSRPPGLLVTGYACEVINNELRKDGKPWVIEEGYEYTNTNLSQFLALASTVKKDTHYIETNVSATPPPETAA